MDKKVKTGGSIMNKHTVFVAGKRFILLSDDKEEYVKKLAEDVSAAISNIIAENPSLDRRSAALLCALDYADDKEKEKLRNKSLSDKAQPLIAQADKQSKQIKELSESVQKKDEEIAALKERLKQLSVKDLQTEAKEAPVSEEKTDENTQEESEEAVQDKPEKPMGRKKKKKNKGYKPIRQYSLFDNEKD